jgi:uncharacterized protein YccT (UPF0319 family)
VKNGSIQNGKPKWMCNDCRRQCVANPAQSRITTATKHLVDNLLLERMSLAGIVRATGVSARWLQYNVNTKDAAVPRSVTITEQKKGTWPSSATNSGPSWARNAAGSGFGWQSTEKRARSWE